MRRLVIALALVAPLAGATGAQAVAAYPVTWRVVEATHDSSATKAAPGLTGRATMAWRLARPTPAAANRVVIGAPPLYAGYGTVNVRGSATNVAETERGRCALAAATGDRRYGYAVPQPFALNLVAARNGGLEASISARYVSLGTDYFGSECGLGIAHQPGERRWKVTRVPASALKGRRVVLRWSGQGGGGGEAYRWSTRIVLQR